MSTPFDGSWTDMSGKQITITSESDFVTVTYASGRGPFTGVAASVGFPVIYVDHTDDRPYTAVLSVQSKRNGPGGNKIFWNNGTVWTRQGTDA
jgi:hypothetical protein